VYLLHISDLHTVGERFTDVWQQVDAKLRELEIKLDAIIVSGDLAQYAKKEEYDELLEVSLQHFVPRVGGNRSSVIFVPGNHDVDWNSSVAKPLRMAGSSQDHAGHSWKDWRDEPQKSRLRLAMDPDFGRSQWLLRDEVPSYHQRFANVQAFIDEFYDGALQGSGGKRFALTKEDGEHWSAHLFEDQRTAIFGFNSCAHNDEHWHGAYIDESAITAASTFIDERGIRDWQLLAVWHHGFTGEPHRPDRLSLGHLVPLNNAGFRVGFHGHTHREDSHLTRGLLRDMVVVSTGSIGAPASERVGVGRQFSIVFVSNRRVKVDVFDAPAGQYGEKETKTFDLVAFQKVDGSTVRARRHERAWKIGANGVATVEIDLRGLRGSGRVPLALLEPPYTNVDVVDGDMKKEKLDDDHIALIWNRSSGGSSTFRASFRVSNAVALSRAELSRLEPRQEIYPGLDKGSDVVSHTVRFDCDRLELSLDFSGSDTAPHEIKPFVQRMEKLDGYRRWRRQPEEERNLERSVVHSSSEGKVSLVVEGPLMGWRYGLQFVPVSTGEAENLEEEDEALPKRAHRLARGLLDRCLDRGGQEHQLRAALVQSIYSAFAKALGESQSSRFSTQTALVSYLWEGQTRQLVPSFGEFLPPCWGDRFACGRGVVGHAFRFCDPAYWSKGEDEGDRINKVIYWERSSMWIHGNYDHRWIAAFPLRLYAANLAIGVVAIGMGASVTPWEQRLSREIEDASRGQASEYLQDLDWQINNAFWQAAVQAIDLNDRSDLQVLRGVLSRLLAHSLPAIAPESSPI